MGVLSRVTMVGSAAFLLVACGSNAPTSQSSPASNASSPSASSSPSPVAKLAANANACELVTSGDAVSLLGELAPGPAPTAEPVPAGPPTMLSGSSCFYHGVRTASDAGLVQVLLGHFSADTAAHDGMQQLLSLISQGAPVHSVSGLGDEAVTVDVPLPTPYSSGRFVVLAVRKGAAVFTISAGVLTGHGPADLSGAVRALAQKAAAKL